MSDIEETKRRKVVIEDDEEDEIPEVEAAVSEEVQQEDKQQDEKEGEAIDDLFGDDDDDDEEEEQDGQNNIDNDIENDGDDDEDTGFKQFEVPNSPEPKEVKIGNEDIVRHPPKFNSIDGKEQIYDAKIPKFFEINPVRFDGNDYLAQLNKDYTNLTSEEREQNSLQKLIDENTIRWRFTKQQSGQGLKAESNAQIVEWEDGSLSLKLGDEVFDVLSNDIKDTYLTTQNITKETGETIIHLVDGVVSKTIKFVPTSTNSKIHKKLTSALQSRQQYKPAAQNVFVDIDPEKEARRLEKLVEDQIREKRRQQLKLEKEQERLGSVGLQNNTSGVSSTRYTRDTYEEGYEDEDGFIDDEDEENDDEDVENIDEDEDEDEEEENTDRLQQIKQDGAQQYDEGTARKKRRVISDDEDDE